MQDQRHFYLFVIKRSAMTGSAMFTEGFPMVSSYGDESVGIDGVLVASFDDAPYLRIDVSHTGVIECDRSLRLQVLA